MGRLNRGDENLHYSDGSHRWIPPRGVEQQIWEAVVRAHLGKHQRAPHSHELPRRAPENAGFVEPAKVPRLVHPEPPATSDSRKPRPRARTGADHSSIAARQRNRSAR